jgi:hypothetical protein
MLFTAIYTERPGPEMIADILVIFARRDELSESDIAGTRQNLEAEGQIVYTKDAESITEFTPTIPTPKPPSIMDAFEGPAGDYLRQTNGMNRTQLEALGAPNSGASPEPRGDAVALRGHTKREATEAMKVLRGFIGGSQLACLADSCRGEEKQFFFDKLCEYADRIAAMPQTYDQDGKGDEAIVHLHYFTGSCDWFITEKDKGTDEERAAGTVEQQQAFGYANLGDPNNAELGYISIVELIANGAELDLYFAPKPLKDCKPVAV